MQDSTYVMVCAVDFGTTFSGYAFSTKATPDDIFMNKNWGSEVGCSAYKAPTCVLTTASGKFEEFGFAAEKAYSEAVEDEDADEQQLNMFRHFKMILHSNKKLTRDTKVKATNGRKLRALDIFAHALKYLKDHMLSAVRKQVAHAPDVDMIRWVLTVPAIWTEESKQFMREAAFKAGCITQKDSRKLVIALEPEAASLCCRRLDIAKYPEGSNLKNFIQPNTRYLIIDCGGGTVDITAHEILHDNTIRELHKATGGPWGGTKVDMIFISFLEEVLGKPFLDSYRSKYPQQWLSLMLQFEGRKKNVSLKKNASINIPLSMVMDEEYTEFVGNGSSLTQTINSKMASGVSLREGHICITAETAKSFFKPVIEEIIQHIQGLMTQPEIEKCKYFFLVGGFSESPILQELIKQQFSGRVNILIPGEAQLAVVMGAVMFGHRPNEIKSRIARKTYGCNMRKAVADLGRDEYIPSKVVTVEGRKLVEDVYHAFVSKGEEVEIGVTREFKFQTTYADQTSADVQLYCMDRAPNTEGMLDFVDDPGVHKVGQFVVDTPGRGVGRLVRLCVTFGGTEIQIEAESSGKKVSAKIDFLVAS